ncbi:MAG: hypothetical protein WB767_14445 [Nocardioides sp.]
MGRRDVTRGGDVIEWSHLSRLVTSPLYGGDVAMRRAPWVGLAGALLLVAASIFLPTLLGWEVFSRAKPELPGSIDPLHAFFEPRWFGPGTLPALLLAALGVRYGAMLADRLPWPRLVALAYLAGLGWLVSLAVVDGLEGLSRPLSHSYEYLETARAMDDVPAALDGWIERIPLDATNNWPTHVAGHPPLATLFFVALARLGLAGDLQAGIVVTLMAASIAPAVLITLKVLGVEWAARRVAPFVVLTPAAVFMAVSADAMFAAVAAWGMAALAVAATAPRRNLMVGWSVVAGLLLGSCVMLSYGLPLLGVLALAVLAAARSWWPLPIAAVSALAVVLVFAGFGFAWWEAYPVLVDRYWDGLASDRPAGYWVWGDLGAFLLSGGPLLGAGVALLMRRAGTHRTIWLLAGAGTLMVLLADLSQMSRAEVERIWLPFVPWVTVSLALLPDRWLKWGLALQVATALLVEHLLYTSW